MGMTTTYKKLEKLCPGDKYPTQQRFLDNVRISGTCQWFLNHETTQAWLDGDEHHVLWLHGPSASGKTFLSSSLVNHIHHDQYENIACGVFYFGRIDLQHNLADYDLAFRSITRQLVSQTPDSLGLWQNIVDDEEMETPCLDVSSKIIKQLTSTFDKIIVILDGVDATNESGLKDLFHLLFDKRVIPSLKILITSRLPFPNALDRTDLGISQIEARAPESDIGLYFASYIDESPVNAEFPDPARVRLFPYKKFFDLSNGLFLPLLPQWFSNIASQPDTVFLDLVESWLPELKDDMSKAFCEAVMEYIKSSKDANLIMCVIYHLIVIDNMGYLFTVPMAHEALDAWGDKRPDGNPFTTSEIMKSCKGLIFLDEKSQTIVMRSPLLMEHIRTNVLTNFHHEVYTRVTMKYLSKEDFANGASKSSAQLKERFRAHPYLWFAAKSLSPNFTMGDCFESYFLALTASQGSIESYQQAAEAWPYLDDESYDECERSCERWRCYTTGYTALHLAASLGVADVMVHRLIKDGAHLEARDGSGQTALHIAAGIEDESVTLKSLLLAGSDVAVKDRDDLTPLAICVVHGNLASVKLLIEYGANVSTLDEEDLEECAREKPEIAHFLVELGIDMPDVDEDEDEDENDGN